MFLVIEPLTTRGGKLRKTTNSNTQQKYWNEIIHSKHVWKSDIIIIFY